MRKACKSASFRVFSELLMVKAAKVHLFASWKGDLAILNENSCIFASFSSQLPYSLHNSCIFAAILFAGEGSW